MSDTEKPALKNHNNNNNNNNNKCTLLECQYTSIKRESANWGHYFHVSLWSRNRHFTWSSEPREGLSACSVKGVPSFVSYSDPE